MSSERLGYRDERVAKMEAVIAANPGHADRILGKPVHTRPAKVHHISIDLRTGVRTVTTAASINPSARKRPAAARPRLAPLKFVRVSRIVAAIAKAYEVDIASMLGWSRQRRLSNSRFALYRLITLTFGWSTPKVGKAFRRHHTTILHGLGRAEWLLEHDPEWSRRYAIAAGELSAVEPTPLLTGSAGADANSPGVGPNLSAEVVK